ncbi:cytochrome P450 2K1-like [Cyprinodon tularosa]|uniref:cytochrome P450 2K1-like n=1 Tax=Cyprinodon tularosa TaxID=77115 RepID=UPI0018E217FC|nr:cytochrome P450 2K1-like [Cyprinodon tularosa]
MKVCPTTVLGVVVLFIVIYLVSVGSTFREIGIKPLGLKPLPLLGNLLQMDLQRPYKTLCQLSKKYGCVFTVYSGPKKVVVLAGHKMVEEAMVNYADEFGDREITHIFDDRTKGHGILFSNGETWKDMRQFALITLREFGMGKRVAEEKILEECRHLIQTFENDKGKPLNTSRPINYARSNISSSIVCGSRFEYDDPSIKRAG